MKYPYHKVRSGFHWFLFNHLSRELINAYPRLFNGMSESIKLNSLHDCLVEGSGLDNE